MPDKSTVYYILGSVTALLVVQRVIGFFKILKSVRYAPGRRLLIHPYSVLGLFFPFPVPGIFLGRNFLFNNKHEDCERFDSDIVSLSWIFPSPGVLYNCGDAAACKLITSQRALWPKRTENYDIVKQFGDNIVATEGDEWKKHRRIANPAFSEPNNKLVFEESVRITLDMINNVWQNKDVVEIEHIVDTTVALTLLIIGSAGFGRRISYAQDLRVPEGHKMPFKDALHTVSTDMILRLAAPHFLRPFWKKLDRVHVAFEDLKKYMQEMIDERRQSEVKAERHDLFNSLLDANMDEENMKGGVTLDDSELLGNIFIFLLAGHETTAHTLAFSLGLLALYPDEEERLYQGIKRVLPDGRLPTYEDMNALTCCLDVFFETLRLFPPVPGIPKKSAEDTTLMTTNNAGERVAIVVPKGSSVNLYTPGMHYNPKYWKDPSEFRPQRFREDWPRDAFLPFSGGARSCIGRRFSETEAVAILAVLIARYRVELKEEPQFAHETFEQRKERILRCKPGITLTPIRIPLVFVKRT